MPPPLPATPAQTPRRPSCYHALRRGACHGFAEVQQGHPKYKTKYRTRNWRAYEAGLKSRGDVTVWLSDEAIASWTPPNNGRRGGQLRYSNLAILTALTLRLLFHLPLRQTEGFVASVLRLMAVDLAAPDHTTLSRRNSNVDVPQPTSSHDGPLHLIVDSTVCWLPYGSASNDARQDLRLQRLSLETIVLDGSSTPFPSR